jgi:hypothetical protein
MRRYFANLFASCVIWERSGHPGLLFVSSGKLKLRHTSESGPHVMITILEIRVSRQASQGGLLTGIMARYRASSGLRTEREPTDDNPEPLEIDEPE